MDTVRALTRAVPDLAELKEDEQLCLSEISATRGRFSDPAGSLLAAACVLSWWFYGLSEGL